jgi:hypothetical protein
MELKHRETQGLTPDQRIDLLQQLQRELEKALEPSTLDRDLVTDLVRKMNELSTLIRADRQQARS